MVSLECGEEEFIRRWIPTLLVDEAWDWYRAQPGFGSWDIFKVRMYEHFQPRNSDDRIHETSPGETSP